MTNSEVPRPDIRKCWRSSVLLTALLSSPAGLQTVRIRNISPSGAMVGGDRFPREETCVTLRRGDLRVTGRVTWRRAGLAGVTFDRDVDVDAWMDHNQRPAARKADWDNGGNPLANPKGLEAESGQVTFAWVSSRLSEISDQLANSTPMRVELAEALLEIDALAKFLRVGGDPARMREVECIRPATRG
jgi:hypothetical protein